MNDFPYEANGLKGKVVTLPKPMGRFHHHSEIELNYVFSGSVTYLYQWQLRTIAAGQLTAFWGAPPHSLVSVFPNTEMAWLTIPLPWLMKWPIPPAIRQALLNGRWCVADGENRYPIREWIAEAQEKNATEPLLLEVQACLLRLRESHRKSAPRVFPKGDFETIGWENVAKMTRFMAEHFTENLGVEAIAAAARLHPKYAMQLFHRCCGVTIRAYLERHRLAHAQMLLITTPEKIIEIAYASGFNSLSAFYERFQKSVRCSPRVFRKHYRHEAGI